METDHLKAYDRDRDSRVLTGTDWSLLLGSDSGGPTQRHRLRQHVRNALLDFRVLFDKLPPGERDGVFVAESGRDRQIGTRENASGTIHADPEIHDACASFIGFLFQQYRSADTPFPNEGFKNLVEAGVERAMLADGYRSTAFVDIEITDVEPVEDVTDRARSKDPADYRDMTVRELRALARAGDLTDDEFERVVEARFDAMAGDGLIDRDDAENGEGGDGQ